MPNQIPNWKEKQKLLFDRKQPTSKERLSAIGNECLNTGYYEDALEYFLSANNEEGLSKLQTKALEDGDSFLLLAIEKEGKKKFSNEIWNQLAERAMELGKETFARRAFLRANNQAALQKHGWLTPNIEEEAKNPSLST